jgi:hypothetical protein
VREWVLANLFLLSIVAVGTVLGFLGISGVRALGLPIDIERLLVAVVAVAALIGAGLWARHFIRGR